MMDRFSTDVFSGTSSRSQNGNMFAQLLFALDNRSDKEIERKRKRVSEHISEYFDESQEVDKYFIEILTTNF